MGHSNYCTILCALFIFLIEVARARCPKNGIKGTVEGSCYFGIDVNETFSSADSFCSTYFYGNLASITSASDDSNVQDLARGLFKTAKYVWLGGTYNGTKVLWLDGSADVYQNFVAGAPPGKIVLDLITGNWSTASWNALLPYVCLQIDNISPTIPPVTTSSLPLPTTPAPQPSTNAPQTTPTPPLLPTTPPSCPRESPCPSEWLYAAVWKKCYRKFMNMNADQAIPICASFGGNLASIHNDEENRIINQMLETGIEVQDQKGATGALIGAKRTGPGANEWMWLDGTPWDYTNWASKQPDNNHGTEDCIEIYPDRPYTHHENGYRWNDRSCATVYLRVVCQLDAKF